MTEWLPMCRKKAMKSAARGFLKFLNAINVLNNNIVYWVSGTMQLKAFVFHALRANIHAYIKNKIPRTKLALTCDGIYKNHKDPKTKQVNVVKKINKCRNYLLSFSCHYIVLAFMYYYNYIYHSYLYYKSQ